MSIQVDIPENYLLIIADYGTMGSGELPDSMRLWAQKICIENGLDGKLKELQENNVKELKARIKNILKSGET